MTNPGNGVTRRRSTTHSSTPAWLIAVIVVFALVMAAFALGIIDNGMTTSARLSEANANVSGGKLSAFDISPGTTSSKRGISTPPSP